MTMARKAKSRKERKRVDEEVAEAVSETVSAWRRLLRPRVLITTAVIILFFLLFYFAFKLHATVSEDLVITLSPTSNSLRLTHGENGTASFTLGTNNYLFCEASCSYELVNLGSGSVVKHQEELLLDDSKVNLSFTFHSPAKGEGQILYALKVTCANIKKRSCTRSDEKHRTSALITIDYTLNDEEVSAKATANKSLPAFLASVKKLDLLTQELTQNLDTIEGSGEELASLRERRDRLKEERDTLKRRAETDLSFWNQEEYQRIETVAVPLEEAQLVEQDLFTYVETQHELVDAINELGEEANQYAIAFSFLNDERDAFAYSQRILRFARRVEQEPMSEASGRLTTLLNETARVEAFKEEGKKSLLSAIAKEKARLNLTSINENASLEQLYRKYQDLCMTNKSNESENVCVNATATPFEEIPSLQLEKLFFPAIVNLTSDVETSLSTHTPVCCLNGKCETCCDGGCEKAPPILFLHGHSVNERNAPEYSLETFSNFQEALPGYVDAGVLTPYDRYAEKERGVWGRMNEPVSVRGTYYYDSYLNGGSYILSAEKSESIDTYAIRVKELVDTLRERTGSDQVTIVAHSMGGLVARRYLQIFGDENVAQLIMIGTPNHGVEASVASLCPWLGADKECEEMQASSPFLLRLNDPSNQPSISLTEFIGRGCDMHGENGDGVVTVESATLDGAENILVNGTCKGSDLLHTALPKPSRFPQILEKVVALLRG